MSCYGDARIQGKLQLGEVMPNAIQVMAKATKKAGLSMNGTVKEMMDLQKNGKLLSEKVLPHFAELMSEAARNNGGLEAAMKSNRVAMNQMSLTFQEAADNFFKSGFSEGLTEVFRSTASMIKNNQAAWSSLGKILGGVLKGLAVLIKGLEVALNALGMALEGLVFIFGDFAALLALPFAFAFVKKMAMMTASVLTFGRATAAANAMAVGGGLAGAAGKAGMLARVGSMAAMATGPVGLGVMAGLAGLGLGVKYLTSDNDPTQAGGSGSSSSGSFMRSLVSKLDAITGISPSTPVINVKLDVDGETVAQKVVDTQTMENHTDSRIHHNAGG